MRNILFAAILFTAACSSETPQAEAVDSAVVVDSTPVVKDTATVTTDSTQQ